MRQLTCGAKVKFNSFSLIARLVKHQQRQSTHVLFFVQYSVLRGNIDGKKHHILLPYVTISLTFQHLFVKYMHEESL